MFDITSAFLHVPVVEPSGLGTSQGTLWGAQRTERPQDDVAC